LLARASTRRGELLVRSALGASRGRLARQLLTESALLGLIGSVAGALLAFWLVQIVSASIPVELPYWVRIEIDPRVLVFNIAISCCTGLFAGFLPAWQATRIDLAESLKTSGAGNTGSTRDGARTREILTAAQVAVSVVLLVGASLVLRGMMNLQEVDPGFDARQVLLMEVNPTYRNSESAQVRVDRFTRLVERLAQIPGVAGVASNNSPPFHAQRPWNRAHVMAEGQSMDEQATNPRANFQTVSPDYFGLLRIPLQRGRSFDERDNLNAPRVCIVSENLAQRLWPGQEPLGRRLMHGKPDPGDEPDWMTVVGVVRDVRHQALDRDAGPDLYNPSSQLAWKQMHFLVRAQPSVEPMSLAATVRREVAAIEPEVGVFNFVSLGREVANSLWQPRLRAWLLGSFSVVALILAAAGLHGVVAYGVTQRTREIGIRMALGAQPRAVLRLIMSEGMRAVAIGIASGLGASLLLSRVVEASLFGISRSDLFSYGVACLLLSVAAAIACWFPARRASLINPMEALRNE